jgi:hypothetical protein
MLDSDFDLQPTAVQSGGTVIQASAGRRGAFQTPATIVLRKIDGAGRPFDR